MKSEKSDQIVFSKDQGYHAHILPYTTNVGAPAIKLDDVVSWKNRGIQNVNREFENRFDELKLQFQQLMSEYQWNEMVYNARFSFEPIVGQTYHLYAGDDGINFLSLIAPQEWNKPAIGTFKLNSDKKWIVITFTQYSVYSK